MPEKKELIVETKDSICIITLNRPDKRNSLTPSMLVKLDSSLKKLRMENEVRCAVIRGAGEKAFSSGYDISSIEKDTKVDLMRDYREGHPLKVASDAIQDFPYPVIAMMNGHSFGAGLEIAVTCDIRIAVEGALFGMPPAKLGLAYSYSGIRKFINLIGLGHTKELFLVGKPADSKRAGKIGLVNHVLPKSELEKFTYKMASEIAENAPLSMSTMKQIINIWQRNQIPNPEEEEKIKEMMMIVQESDDCKEGQRAFAEKRKPEFEGK